MSVSLTRDGRLLTSAYSHEGARVADEAQYGEGSGPCVEALTTSHPVSSAPLTEETRWPAFRDVALASGYASILSLPLGSREKPVAGAALNLYSNDRKGFDEGQAELGKLFAEQAGILFAEAKSYADAAELSTNLRTALESREIIGEAKGILMERERVSSEEATCSVKCLRPRT